MNNIDEHEPYEEVDAHLQHYNPILLEKFIHYNNKYGLDFQDKGEYLSGCCFLHGGDNASALTIYKDAGRFYCWTHNCHNKAKPNNIQYLLDAIEYQYKERDAYSIPLDSVASKLTLDIRHSTTNKPKYLDRAILNGLQVPSSHYILKGLSANILNKYGVGDTNKYHNMPHRAIFPVFYENNLIGITGRSLDGTEPKWKHKGPIRQYIYGFDFIKKSFEANNENRTLVITEGPPDALKVIEGGFQAFPLFGCSISNNQLMMLHRLNPSKVVLWLDGDDAGQEAAITIQKKLSKFYDVSNIQTKEDPDEFTTQQIQEILNECK